MYLIFKRFLIELLLGILLAFSIHLTILNLNSLPLFDNSIITSYIVNMLLAFIIFTALYLVRDKFKNEIGFLFMGGSFLKFFIFFLVFLPVFKEDGSINKLEFASFFVPYTVCLVIETLGVIRLLKN
ncbi:hypothetical protein BX611_0997 [Lutibacter oceani]|uniref:ATP synthase protein I n=1 Tax=Lutibacter oceani TaxID=1853311 RepID=A0A3D9S570_9FLAO|nr:hypothetical protein [Lutibacter oceani]REE83702.1 hypothetical protein BX611_0997 [Lutibacter oceani]